MADAYYRYPANSSRDPNAAQRQLKPLPPAPQYFPEGSSGQHPRVFCSRNTRGYFPAVNQIHTAENVPPLSSYKVEAGNHRAAVSEEVDETQEANRWSNEYDIDGNVLRPQHLKKPTLNSVLFTVGDIFMALIPVLFIVLAILAAKLNNKPVENNTTGKNVGKALRLGPTIFPIVFAAVAGRGMKTIGRFSAERGTKLGMLELLVASQTVWGAFETQVRLRHLSLVGLHLLLLWSLSPLGSQASFRILGSGLSATSNSSRLFFMPTGGMSVQQFFVNSLVSGDAVISIDAMNAQYNAALLSSNKRSEDSWTNVRIPWHPEPAQGQQDRHGWVPVQDAASSDQYSALVGLPIARKRSTGAATFEVPVSYLKLECHSKWNVTLSDDWWRKQLGQIWGKGGVYEGRNPFSWDPERNTINPANSKHRSKQLTSFFLDTDTEFGSRFNTFFENRTLNQRDQSPLRNLLFGSQHSRPFPDMNDPQASTVEAADYMDIILRKCTVEMPYLDARVRCDSEQCKVVATRQSSKYQFRDPAITPLDSITVAGNMFTKLPLSGGVSKYGATSASELFILGSKTPLLTDQWSGPSDTLASTPYEDNGIERFSNMFEVPDEVFSRRLGIILNTYYMLSISPYAFNGHLPSPPHNSSSWAYSAEAAHACKDCISGPFYSETANATFTHEFEVYKCNFVWLALLLAASAVLLILGTFGTLLKGYCFAPDMLGFVSSSTYDNKYMDLPTSGALDGMERARLLKHVTVKIGDVWRGRKVGHVALSCGEKLAAPLRRDKLYV